MSKQRLPPPPPPRILRILRAPVVCGVLFVLVLFQLVNAINIVEESGVWRIKMGDYGVYVTAGAIVRDGKSPYKRDNYLEYKKRISEEKIIISAYGPYLYSPHTAVAMSLFYPLAGAPLEWIWTVISLIAVFSGVWLMVRTVGQGDRLYLALGLVFMASLPVWSQIRLGNVISLVFFALALGLYLLFARERRWGNIVVISGAFAFGTLTKLMPLPLICWLLWRGYKRIFLCTLIWAVVLTLASLWIIDWFIYEQYYLKILSGKGIHVMKEGFIFRNGSSSFEKLLLKATIHHKIGARFIAIIFLTFTMVCCWRPLVLYSKQIQMLECGMIITCLLLMPLKVHGHSYMICLFPLLVVVKDFMLYQRWKLVSIISIALLPTMLYFAITAITMRDIQITRIMGHMHTLLPLVAITLNIYLGLALIHHKRLFSKVS